MRTGREALDAILAAFWPDEEVFVLRSKDPFAADTVRDWAMRAHDGGVDTAVIEEALKRADAMEAQRLKVQKRDAKARKLHPQGGEPEDTGLPGIDHLTDAQAKQLRYEFTRRLAGRRFSELYSHIDGVWKR